MRTLHFGSHYYLDIEEIYVIPIFSQKTENRKQKTFQSLFGFQVFYALPVRPRGIIPVMAATGEK